MKKVWWTSIPTALLITASTAVIAQASPLTSSAWQASGPGKFTITQDANGGEAFGYNDNHDPYSPYSQKTFTFDSVAPDSESLSFNWDYSGMHSWFAAYAGAQAFADGPNGRTTITLVPYTGVGGGFDFKGKSQLTIYKGYDYGFIVQGQNFDYSQLIQGTLTIDPAVTIPTTTASTDVQANAAGWYNKNVTVTLSATDQGGNVASTMYSLDHGQTWNTYTTPFVVSTEGNNTVQYYSTSTDGGQEQAQTLSIPLERPRPPSALMATAEPTPSTRLLTSLCRQVMRYQGLRLPQAKPPFLVLLTPSTLVPTHTQNQRQITQAMSRTLLPTLP